MFEQDKLFGQLFEDEDSLTEKQKEVLAAATILFAEKGFAATSTSEIAKKAGVAEGTIFRHYKTKKDLLLSIVGPVISRIIAPFVVKDFYKVLEKDYEQLEDFLREVIKNRTKFAKDNISLIRIFIQEIPFHAELREQFKARVAKDIFEKLKQIIVHYQEKGQIIAMAPDAVVRLVASTVIGSLLARFLLSPETEWDDDMELERTLQFLMNGLSPKK